jgi:hypothetical protein
MVAYHRSGSRFTAVVIFVISYAFWPAAIVLAYVLRRPGGWFADPWSEAPYRWIEQQGAAPARWTDPARSPA